MIAEHTMAVALGGQAPSHRPASQSEDA
jgi:hypothetical protein